MRKTSLLSVITDTIDHEDLEYYRENIIEQIREFLTAILTSSPLKSNYNSEIKILFTFRPARSEFAIMIYQEKFKSVKFFIPSKISTAYRMKVLNSFIRSCLLRF